MNADAARARGPDQHGGVPGRQPRAGRLGRQGDAIDPSVVDADGVYRHRGPARVFVSRARRDRRDQGAAAADAGQARRRDRADRRRAARHRDGRDLPAHVGAEVSSRGARRSRSSPTRASPACRPAPASATSGPRRWPAGRSASCVDGDVIEIVIDRQHARGARRTWSARAGDELDAGGGGARCWRRARRTRSCAPHGELPDDTRLWAALQQASGGTWGGCVYDVDRDHRGHRRRCRGARPGERKQ